MKAWMTRRTLLVAGGAALLLGLAFAAGTWVGVDYGGGLVGAIHGHQVLPRASVNARKIHHQLLLLDGADYGTLRGELDVELESELQTMCRMLEERAGSSDEAIERARTVLRRVAEYRTKTPPVYTPTYAAGRDERVAKLIQDCLRQALGPDPAGRPTSAGDR